MKHSLDIDSSLDLAPSSGCYPDTCNSKIQGMSVGYGDEYWYGLDGQWIDLPPSVLTQESCWELCQEIFPPNGNSPRVEEVSTDDNKCCIYVHFSGDRTFDLLDDCSQHSSTTTCGGAPTTTATDLDWSQSLNGQSSVSSPLNHYKLTSPLKEDKVARCNTSGPNGDADLYVNFGRQASTTDFVCRSRGRDSNESCSTPKVSADTDVYVAIEAYTAYDQLTITCDQGECLPDGLDCREHSECCSNSCKGKKCKA